MRLATRDLGIQSAIAKGALRPRSRFGAGLELLSEGVAQLYYREQRELHTLAAFDIVDLRQGLARDVARFAAAAAYAEVMMRMAPPSSLPPAYDALLAALNGVLVQRFLDASTDGVDDLLRHLKRTLTERLRPA